MSALALLCRHALGARPLHADNGRTGFDVIDPLPMGRGECTVCGNWLLVQYRPGRIGQCRVHQPLSWHPRGTALTALQERHHRCRGHGTQGRRLARLPRTPLRQLQPGGSLRLVLRSPGAEWRGWAVAAGDRTEAKLEALLRRHNHRYIRYSEAFNNAEQLLVQMQAARPRRHRLEEEAHPIQVA